MLNKLVEEISAVIHYQNVVKNVRWEPGSVEVEAQTPAGIRQFRAGRLLVTLPLGVLKTNGVGSVTFSPSLAHKTDPISNLEIGAVVKITLHFRQAFWREDFGFLHSADPWLPTWWTGQRPGILTGWAGGPRAELLAQEHSGTILEQALHTLSILFKTEPTRIRELLVSSYYHDWIKDPFSRGAYSYTPVGMMARPRRLAKPIEHTLFFAGEATDSAGDQGTVHGALSSGKRAAKRMLATLRQTRKRFNQARITALTLPGCAYFPRAVSPE